MASRRYNYVCSLSWGGDTPTAELDDVEVSFEVSWGTPETGRFGPVENYDPGSGSEVEDIRVESIDGRPATDYLRGEYMPGSGMAAIIDKLEMDHWDRMLKAAADQQADRDDADRDYRDEARAERLREDF